MTHTISRRQALGQLAGFSMLPLGAGLLSRALAAKGGNRPNILYIMADDHASHALSCYGSRINKTPNLDRIATGGMRFNQCFCTNSLCGPSRAVLLTGKYNHLNGFKDNAPTTVFDGSQQTFPKLLQKAGYQTAIVGKWHLNSTPTGFDYWSILPGQGQYNNPPFLEMTGRKVHQGYVTDIITDKSLDWMKGRDKNKPFCLMTHHKAPHRNWVPDARHAKMYEDETIPKPVTFDDDWSGRGRAAHEQEMTIEKHLNKQDLKVDPPAGLTGQALKEWKYQRFIKDYLRVIASIDDNVGRTLDYLDKDGLADNTIVIYSSDNGFFLADHGWFDKRFMYEHSQHVPFVVRYPAAVKAGSVSEDLVINADFAETFLDFAAPPIPTDMQGRSLRPVLTGAAPADWRKSVYYRYYEFPQPHHVQPHYGVRTAQHKLIYYNTINEWELFDLTKDPNELKSVYDDPGYAQVRDELKAELNRLRAQLKDTD